MSNKRAVVYARLSDVRKDDTEGIDRQLREGRAHAARLELDVVEELVDNDVSASKTRPRPAFERLMTGIGSGTWDVVVLRSLDRWVRRPAELERIIETVEKTPVRIEAIHGEIDLRTRQGRMAARILTSVAMHEVEAIEERVRDWHTDRAARGLPLHGPPGYGFRRPAGTSELEIDPLEAARIREAADRVLAGEPMRAIARDYTARDVPAPGAGRWTGQLLRRILLAPRTAGQRVHRGEIVAAAQWPAILDPDTHQRLRRYLTDPARRSPGSRAPRLLTGTATCHRCDAGLNHRTDQGKPRYYCRHCRGTIVSSGPLDRLVAEMIFDAVDHPRLADTLHAGTPDTTSKIDELLALETDLETLAHELGEGRLTLPEWKLARAGIDRRITVLRSELDAHHQAEHLAPWAGRPGALRAAWNDLTGQEQRAIVAALFDRIEIRPARRGLNTFDPDRVHPVWRTRPDP